MHDHYDANDVRTGYTVVERESPWDDETRARAVALTDYESSFCGCGCGQPRDVAYDKNQAFKVETFTCYAGRARDRVSRQDHEAAEREKRPEGWTDGLHYTVIPHEPD